VSGVSVVSRQACTTECRRNFHIRDGKVRQLLHGFFHVSRDFVSVDPGGSPISSHADWPRGVLPVEHVRERERKVLFACRSSVVGAHRRSSAGVGVFQVGDVCAGEDVSGVSVVSRQACCPCDRDDLGVVRIAQSGGVALGQRVVAGRAEAGRAVDAAVAAVADALAGLAGVPGLGAELHVVLHPVFFFVVEEAASFAGAGVRARGSGARAAGVAFEALAFARFTAQAPRGAHRVRVVSFQVTSSRHNVS